MNQQMQDLIDDLKDICDANKHRFTEAQIDAFVVVVKALATLNEDGAA
jgi:hypothetical protein